MPKTYGNLLSLRYLLRDPTIDGYSDSDTAIPGGSGFDTVEEKEKIFRLITELMKSIGEQKPRSATRYHDRPIFQVEGLQEEVPSCSPSSDSVSPERIGQFLWNSVSGGCWDSDAGSGLGLEEEDRWLNHYSSRHGILLVGEGDFSFSASLAMAFGSASNIVATSLNLESFLRKNYRNAMSNIQKLTSRGAKVFHGVDATEMATHSLLQGHKFNRIIFNFPLSGFFPMESNESVLQRHRELVRLFMANAKIMLGRRGEIHITHKLNGFFQEWKLEELGSSEGLELIEELPFNPTDYPGYQNKYGFGGDNNFDCYPCNTYKFGLKRRSRIGRGGRSSAQTGRGKLPANPMNINLSKIIEREKAKTMPKPDHPYIDFGGIPMTIFKQGDPRKYNFHRNWLIAEEKCLIDNIWACFHKKGPLDEGYMRSIIEALANYFKTNRKNFNFYVVYQGNIPGVYRFWPEVVKATKNVPNPLYKGFEDLPSELESAREHLGPNFFWSENITDYATVVDGTPIVDLVGENTQLKQQLAYSEALRAGLTSDPFEENTEFYGEGLTTYPPDIDYFNYQSIDNIPCMDNRTTNPVVFPRNYVSLADLEAKAKEKGNEMASQLSQTIISSLHPKEKEDDVSQSHPTKDD